MKIDFRTVTLGLGLAAVAALGGQLMTSHLAAPDHRAPSPPPSRPATAVASAPPVVAAKETSALVAVLPPAASAAKQRAPAAPPPASLPPSEGKSGAGERPPSAFTHFRVGDRNVKRILVDGDRIWVGTSGGVIRYVPASDEYRLLDVRSGLRASNVVVVGKIRGGIVAGSLGGGLSVLDPKTDRWETFGVDEGLGDNSVHDVLQASGGDVWIATRAGVSRVSQGAFRDRDSWTHFTAAGTDRGLPSDRVYALAEGRGGDIWLATEAGVALYRKGTWQNWRRDAEGSPAARGPAGGTDGATPAAHGTSAAHASGVRAAGGGADANFVLSVAVDRSGVVWAGTLGGGLLRFDGSRWRAYTVSDGLPGNHVFTLHQDAKNLLWVGTNNGLARMEDGKFKVMTTKDGLFTNAVFAVASAPDALWVGGYGGVARIRPAR